MDSERLPSTDGRPPLDDAASPETPAYLEQDSAQTLGEALIEYYEYNSNLLDPKALPAEVAEMFRRHDAGHVVFGCDTSLRGETLIDTWTVVGTTAGVRGYLEYFNYPQVNQVFADVGYLRIVIESLRHIPDLIRVIVRSRGQTAKWPWNDYLDHVDRSLADLRHEFGIRVV